MNMPARKFDAGSGYRYGFNGKEKDKDVSEGHLDFGARIFDSRIAKFLSIDPVSGLYPMLTPYQFASNTPIRAIDLDGLEGVQIIDHAARTVTIRVNFIYVIHKV